MNEGHRTDRRQHADAVDDGDETDQISSMFRSAAIAGATAASENAAIVAKVCKINAPEAR